MKNQEKDKAAFLARRRTAALKNARADSLKRKFPRGKAGGVDAILVSGPEDVAYLSGFGGEDSYLLCGDGWAVLLTDGRFGEQAAGQCPGVGVFVRKGGMAAAVADVMKERRVRCAAVQSNQLTLAAYNALIKAVGPRRLVAMGDFVASLRMVKDDGEIKLIVRACKVAQEALLSIMEEGKKGFIGRTEAQIAAKLDYRMRLLGASEPSFETIVAVGPHAALPHYRPGSTVIDESDAVLIDWGAKVEGYCSDLTRVLFIGRIPPRFAGIYGVVQKAQKAAAAVVKSGADGQKADLTARKVIEQAGFGEYFVHSLGHGLGRQVHELPVLSRLSKSRLRTGNVVTLEPGIYIPGFGGVRIEDDVLVTPSGARRLSTLSGRLQDMVVR